MRLETEKESSEGIGKNMAANIQRKNAHSHNVNSSKHKKYFVTKICDHRGRDFGDHKIFQYNMKIEIMIRW